MVSRGSIRTLLAPIGALIWLVAFAAASVRAEDTVNCAVHVDPLAATGGSIFVFSGTGYKPDRLTLQKRGDDPIQHDLNVGDADHWEVSVRSRSGDEGSWTATFNDPVTSCTATVDFRVTLSGTDASTELNGTAGTAATTAPAPVLLYLAVVVVGFSGGLMIGRRVQAARRV